MSKGIDELEWPNFRRFACLVIWRMSPNSRIHFITIHLRIKTISSLKLPKGLGLERIFSDLKE